MSDQPETNQYQDSLNFVILTLKDYLDTLPPSSKIAVTAHAQAAINNLNELVNNVPELERLRQYWQDSVGKNAGASAE